MALLEHPDPLELQYDETSVLRGEPFSLEHLEAHARHLASSLVLAAKPTFDPRFARRFDDNAQYLREAYAEIAGAVNGGEPLTPGADWLLDNFYVVEEQLREIRIDLPPRFYRELPKLVTGEPRVYVLARELVVHTDSALDEETIHRFILAFQSISALTIGETWAMPIMLRLVLVENLRRLARQLIHGRRCREQARRLLNSWREPQPFPIDMTSPASCAPIVLQLLEHLQSEGGILQPAWKRLEQQLSEHQLSHQDLVQCEHQRQAADQVSIGNVITSMRMISALDWVVFFESTNRVEEILQKDPAEVYRHQNFDTRNRCRNVVEDLAKRSGHSDVQVAQRVLERASNAPHEEGQALQSHVGYWLLGEGRSSLEKELKFRPAAGEILRRWMLSHSHLTYFGSIGLLTAFGASAIVIAAVLAEIHWGFAGLLGILTLLPASELAVCLTNLWVTKTLPPRLLPKLEFKNQIPSTYSTCVVVPAMLTSTREVNSLLERLENHYLANQQRALRFALLSDWSDADAEHQPSDDELLAQAVAGIRALNLRYGSANNGPFMLLHRRRRWNASEGRWMGWERKRGKLLEFNRWLRGATDTSYFVEEGDVQFRNRPDGVKFVITLDADTQMPYGVAARLIGALAHPLNRPKFDPNTRQVTSGYVILQPRISIHLGSAGKTWFTRIFSNRPGIDPYTTAASDVYQDLFGEGSFTGKGIYDVDAFERSPAAAFPENQILSHDLIEGCHARVALVSDIELIDGFPSRYDADARRQHRWIRGDWQILPWLFANVPTKEGRSPNRLSSLSKWKIFDNLRRSLVQPAMLMLLLVGWGLQAAAAWAATTAVILVAFLPALSPAILSLTRRPRHAEWKLHVRAVGRELGKTLLQALFMLAVLPHAAWNALDAIARTLFRMTFSRRHLLEWETAAATERRLNQSKWSTLRQMWFLPMLAFLFSFEPPIPAIPFLIAWFIAPAIAYWISLPIRVRLSHRNLSELQQQWLRRLTRRTWSFFEWYVNAECNWLPPDNMQEYPSEKVAHRVSPTNEGLFLVSALVARDFGYLSLHKLCDLLENNLQHWTQLEQLHGHFYNWYDTLTLKPLLPRYVSTVDSGNLVACLLTLREGLKELQAAPTHTENLWKGLADTVAVAEEACEQLHPPGARIVGKPLIALTESINAIRAQCNTVPLNAWGWMSVLADLRKETDTLKERLRSFEESGEFPTLDVSPKIRSLVNWIESVEHELRSLYAWTQCIASSTEERMDTNEGWFPTLPWSGATAECLESWRRLWWTLLKVKNLPDIFMLESETSSFLEEMRNEIAALPEGEREQAPAWLDSLTAAIRASASAAQQLNHRLDSLGQRLESLALGMDFRFLFNSQRRLFAIGFNLEEGILDRAHYDILCSEARLASYLAIVKGDVEPRHWFQLGRPVTQTNGQALLLSWGGTMFEYLMPPLFQRNYEGSLLAQSCRAAVDRHRQYGRQHGVPWGISESAFSALAANADYQYKSFGVPGLGLKRGLGKDLVVSPYSTMMALEIDAVAATENLQALTTEGALGPWGFYDSIDYTPQRVPAGRRSLVTRCYMAHHHGMSLLGLANLLHEGCIRRRFNAHPLARAGELLLQERMPDVAPRVEPHADEVAAVEIPRSDEDVVSRRITGTETASPRTHLLANSQFSVMVTNSGGGYSRWKDLAISRWRPDATRDACGQFIYLRDLQSNRVWSATYQPTCVPPDSYEVEFSIDKSSFHRRDGDLESHLEIAVSPENNAEVRQLRITNHGNRTRHIEITTYLEVVLTTQAADVAHPAFQKLFMETEYVRDETSLLARRRPRDSRQEPIWAVHALAAGNLVGDSIEYETNRQTFVGRGRTLGMPAALDPGVRLSGQVGAVLDPIFSLRCTVTIKPHESAAVGITTAVARTYDEALALADQYHDIRGVQRAFELAWAYNQVQLRHLHLSPAKAHLFQRVAGALLYPDPVHRGSEELMRANRSSQRGLWRYGISGDLPILLVHVTKPEHLVLVRELLLAQTYWESHGLIVDVVIVNDYPGSYLDALNEQLLALLNEIPRTTHDRQTHAFLLRGAQLPAEDKALCELAASTVFHGDHGSVGQQWDQRSKLKRVHDRPRKPRRDRDEPTMLARVENPAAEPRKSSDFALRQERIRQLEFWNGIGGFALDGREYHILLTDGTNTPLPWSNVIANPIFGTLITELGASYTWSGNSRENKLTTWSNDPVSDPPSEALYIRDDKTGEVWSPMPGVLRDSGDYWIHHGHGYSRFLHHANGLDHELTISISPDEPVKFIRVTLRNTGQRLRQLALTYFAELVLGVCREQTQQYVMTEIDAVSGALVARNSFHPDYPEQRVFLHCIDGVWSYTGDRTDFLGRCGDVRHPQSLQDPQLSGHVGIGLDPCGAVQTKVRIAPGAEVEVIFLLGAGRDAAETARLLERYRTSDSVKAACDQTISQWNRMLETVQVKTPNRALDLLINRWLLYQTVSCRFWGRSAFYQSGGAFGFRDQLQDSMALAYSRPDLVREHLLRAAARQYKEGDVQHWWHPPEGRGTRTRFSDDFLWLILTTCHYLRITGDYSVLDEEVPFLESVPLEPHEQERYEIPNVSIEQASLYEHCRRAMEHGLRLGPHGLPLMGCGDWNDGMNRVGELGQGESVWVGWFHLVILREFIPIMELSGDHETAKRYQAHADAVRASLEEHAWDGQWYRRAFFDDGTPLGSAQNDECQLDSISQTWSVLADAVSGRSRQAIHAVLERLVRRDDRLVLLLTPPFDRTELDPGYIKGYLPGIRENGGQYTHSAVWLIQALAKLGCGEQAMSIFDLINPINHAITFDDVSRYRVEPYVVAADVYGVAPHIGRGGWSWYTGSAAWMYRVALESLLGFQLNGTRLRIDPRLPESWAGFEITFRRGDTRWRLVVEQNQDAQAPGGGDARDLQLIDDGREHELHVGIPRHHA